MHTDSVLNIERILFYTVLIGISLILGTSYILPMVDLPQHAGQVAALKSIMLGEVTDPWFKDIELNYLTTYWIAYLATLLLSFLMPINYAINTVVAIAFLLFVLSFSYLRKRFNGANVLDWILLPCFFGFSYSWGFLTFLLAIPIGVFLVIQNLDLLKTNNNKYMIRIIWIGILLYFSHMLIFLLFCLMASCMTLVNNGYSLKIKFKQLIPFYLLALLIPFFLMTLDFFMDKGLSQYIDVYYPRYSYGFFGARIAFILLYPWSVIQNPIFPIEFFSILFLVLPFFIGCKLTKDFKRYVPFIIVLLAWFTLPEIVARTNIVYQRFSILLYPCYILIFEKRIEEVDLEKIKIKLVLSCIWIASSLGLLTISIRDIINFHKELVPFESFLLKAPSHRRALYLAYEPNDSKNINTFAYAGSWYQALKSGWVDYNFAWFPPQVVRYKLSGIPESKVGFAWEPQNFSTFKNCDYYDMLIVKIGSEEELQLHEKLMKKSTCSHHLFYRNDKWLLYTL